MRIRRSLLFALALAALAAVTGCGPDALATTASALDEPCKTDADCALGTVCEKTLQGTQCVAGCHSDDQCQAGEWCAPQFCRLSQTPCSGMCAQR